MRAGRQPDKPGTYRVRPDGTGGFKLSGVQQNGARVRLKGLTEAAANEIAGRLFPKLTQSQPIAPIQTWESTDDWGFPIKVSDETVQSVRQTLNIPDPAKLQALATTPAKPEVETPEEREKREKRAKNAKSLMDLAGIAGAAGVVMVGRKLTERIEKEPVKPDTSQVKDLRENIREALTDLFGDSEVEPWKMAILLSLGIIASMMIQSPRKEKPAEQKAATPQGTGLKSVP